MRQGWCIGLRLLVQLRANNQLADEVHVSTATVMRFCKKMGYSGFSELKYKIKEFYEQQDQEDNYEINDIEGFVEHIKSNDYLDKLKKAADLIKGADSFQMLGLGVCRDISKYTADDFVEQGFIVMASMMSTIPY